MNKLRTIGGYIRNLYNTYVLIVRNLKFQSVFSVRQECLMQATTNRLWQLKINIHNSKNSKND